MRCWAVSGSSGTNRVQGNRLRLRQILRRCKSTSSVDCVHCLTGQFQDQTAQSRKNCAVGRHQTPAQAACKKCVVGKFQNTTGQVNCRECITGQFQDQKSKLSAACAAGKHENETASQHAKIKAGKFSNASGLQNVFVAKGNRTRLRKPLARIVITVSIKTKMGKRNAKIALGTYGKAG